MAIILAIDTDGNLVPADNASQRQEYTCLHCGARMHLTRSSLGTRYYALYPGEAHANKICVRTSSTYRTPSIHNTDLALLFKSISRAPRAGHGGGTGGTGGNGGNGGNDPTDVVAVPYTSLAQIATYDLLSYAGLPGFDMITDHITTYRWMQSSSIPRNIIGHFVGVQLISPIPDSLMIAAKMYWREQSDGEFYQIVFALTFVSSDTFNRFCAKNFVVTIENGKTTFAPTYPKSMYLVAATFNYVHGPACRKMCPHRYCKGCKGLFAGLIYRGAQIAKYD